MATILVIDDSASMMVFMEQTLRGAGHAVERTMPGSPVGEANDGLRRRGQDVVADVVGADGISTTDDPARESLVERMAGRGDLASAIQTAARQDALDAAGRGIAAVDRQAVVVHHCADRLGDLLEDSARVQG